MRELAVTMATDGQPLERIRGLLGVAVGPLDLSVKMVFGDAVREVVAALRYRSSPFCSLIPSECFSNHIFKTKCHVLHSGFRNEPSQSQCSHFYALHNCLDSISCYLHCLL